MTQGSLNIVPGLGVNSDSIPVKTMLVVVIPKLPNLDLLKLPIIVPKLNSFSFGVSVVPLLTLLSFETVLASFDFACFRRPTERTVSTAPEMDGICRVGVQRFEDGVCNLTHTTYRVSAQSL